MVGRSVNEWIGRDADAPVPPRVRVRVFERFEGRCYLSGRKIMPGDAWELEHIRPLSMGGENREMNMAPALKAPHAAKSAVEAHDRAKADRIRKKHIGAWPAPKRKLAGRGFDKGRNRQTNREPRT